MLQALPGRWIQDMKSGFIIMTILYIINFTTNLNPPSFTYTLNLTQDVKSVK